MNDLQTALRQLRQEVAAAFTENSEVACGTGHCRGEVNVSLGLVWTQVVRDASVEGNSAGNAGEYRWQVAEPGQPVAHTLQITFQIQRPAEIPLPVSLVTSESVPQTEAAAAAKTSVESEGLLGSCLQVFGTPGFDNSARAEVYREIATSLDSQGLLEAITHAGDGGAIAESEPLQLEIRRLRRLLGYSPVGTQRAAEILRGHIERGESAALLRLLAERWNYGTHWELPGRDATNA